MATTTPQVTQEYVNAEYGIQVSIVHTQQGYGVKVTDMESGESLPMVRYYQTHGQAQMYALKCAFS